MEPKDVFNPDCLWRQETSCFNPRIFLCKSSRFLRNLNTQVDPNGDNPLPQKDSFGTDKFEVTCDPKDLEPKDEEENENSNQDSDYDETSTDTTVRILILCHFSGT